MCAICIDLEKGLMTPVEAKLALRELKDSMDNEHLVEVEETILVLKQKE